MDNSLGFLGHSDSYKYSHPCLTKTGTNKIYSYLESRGGDIPNTCFFGLQYVLNNYFVGQRVTRHLIDKAEIFYSVHFGRDDVFDRSLWDHIADNHDGYLPLKIKSVREGSVIPIKNVLMTIENTDPKCSWLTNYSETILSHIWSPITVASRSLMSKNVIMKYLQETGDLNLIAFKLHDFGYRGVSSVETSALAGAGNLVHFMGTDTISACEMIMQSYSPQEPNILDYVRTSGKTWEDKNFDSERYKKDLKEYYSKNMAGFSIPASEHSTITSWGKENEAKAYANMLDRYPTGLIACVSDSYDIINACENIWGKELKDRVINRDGCLVIRPDSGEVVSSVLSVLNSLGKAFGTVTNEKGYKLLHPKVRVIQGDGIEDYNTLENILGAMKNNSWSADNIAFGSGGGLLQKINRDKMKFAIKCSYAEINGNGIEVYKDPVGDKGKASKRGILGLFKTNNVYETLNITNDPNRPGNLLETSFENGRLINPISFAEVRKNALNYQS